MDKRLWILCVLFMTVLSGCQQRHHPAAMNRATVSTGSPACAKGADKAIATTAELMEAIHKGEVVLVERLLAAGADPNARIPPKNNTPLMETYVNWPNERLSGRMALLLIRAGADVNATNNRRRTALMYAGINGRTEAIWHMLVAGADPNMVSLDGETALMWTAQCGSIHSIRALLQAGADPRILDYHRRSAADWAESNKAIRRLLIQAGAPSKGQGVLPTAPGQEQPTTAPSSRAWELVPVPRAQPVTPMVELLQSIREPNVDQYRSVFVPEISNSKQDWSATLTYAREDLARRYGHFTVEDFIFSFDGNDNEGTITVRFRPLKDLIVFAPKVRKTESGWRLTSLDWYKN